jgi:hypothetical protein
VGGWEFWHTALLFAAALAGFVLALVLIGSVFAVSAWVFGRRKEYCPECGLHVDAVDMVIHRALEHQK